jgi:hypothetical protein
LLLTKPNNNFARSTIGGAANRRETSSLVIDEFVKAEDRLATSSIGTTWIGASFLAPLGFKFAELDALVRARM